MKIIITTLKGFNEGFGEFQISSTKVKGKGGTRESLPKITRATGGPVPPIKVEKDETRNEE